MRTTALAVAVACLIGGASPSAVAEPATARWHTFFYAAPRGTAQVLDEVESNTKLDVRTCADGWCRVLYGEAEGYVRDFVVHGPENDVHADGGSQKAGCFAALQPGGAAWQSETFCRSK